MNTSLTFQIIRTNRKSITLHISSEAKIIVKAPKNVSKQYITKLIEQKEDWIQKRVILLSKKKSLPKQYQTGETFMYLGESYTFIIGDYKTIFIQNKSLFFPKFLLFRAQKEIQIWYMQQAKKIITNRTLWYAKQMKLTYKEISFADTKSRWGACSFDNNLQFNWRLILAPLAVIDYVVVHELVHTVEKNHTWVFWSKVRFILPAYRQRRLWLKRNEYNLEI